MDDITVQRRGAKVMECVKYAKTAVRILGILCALAAPSSAQTVVQTTDADSASAARPARHYWRDFAAGFAASLIAHEGAHIVTSYAVGSHPSFGFDKGRPTVYSNINVDRDPRKQAARFVREGLIRAGALPDPDAEIAEGGDDGTV